MSRKSITVFIYRRHKLVNVINMLLQPLTLFSRLREVGHPVFAMLLL
jgi:hypothetical protein